MLNSFAWHKVGWIGEWASDDVVAFVARVDEICEEEKAKRESHVEE